MVKRNIGSIITLTALLTALLSPAARVADFNIYDLDKTTQSSFISQTYTTPILALNRDSVVHAANVVTIQTFGAKDFTVLGNETADSSTAIQNAINYASANYIATVDFGSGKYYAHDVQLASNITYIASGKAELWAAEGISAGHAILAGGSNIVLDGLTLNGNWNKVFPLCNGIAGKVISLYSNIFSNHNITIKNCLFTQNAGAAIFLAGSNNVNINHNRIADTDCGVIAMGHGISNAVIDSNEIYGIKYQYSEPISIYGDAEQGLSHDITITNNKVHDKLHAGGILVQNATRVLVDNNQVYNVAVGINVGEQCATSQAVSKNITITNNNVQNCDCGVSANMSDSLVANNTISNNNTKLNNNPNNTGIGVSAPYAGQYATNTIIKNNIIKNIGGTSIILMHSKKCVVDSNTFIDDGTVSNTHACIKVNETDNDSNIIQNNSNFCRTTGPTDNSIIVYHANNTILVNNTANITDQGTGTVGFNNKLPATRAMDGWVYLEKHTLLLSHNSSIFNMDYNYWNIYTVNTISGEFSPITQIGRQVTLQFNHSSHASIVSGGNIILAGGVSFIPTALGATITFKFDGTNWNEVSRNDSSTPTGLDVTAVSKINDIGVANGTALNNITTPSAVTLTLSDNSQVAANVLWHSSTLPTYSATTPGTYVMVGDISLPGTTTNLLGLQAIVNIVVSP